MKQESIRNVAIIAHVDHGKTTLVDRLFEQGGQFEQRTASPHLVMDSMDLERERGITITSKTGAFSYKDTWINIIDTPGHADFGGQVERVLGMADGALLLVDAQEGPMPQTFFVLKKALALNLPIIVIINKIDKDAARPDWVIDQVFDSFVKLNAPEDILDFPIIFASAKNGYAMNELSDPKKDIQPILQAIIDHIPSPSGDPKAPLQMQVSSIDYSPYLGRLAIGKITGGSLNVNREICVVLRDGSLKQARITKVYRYEKNERVVVEEAITGEIVAVAGMDDVTVGVTYTDPNDPSPLPPMEIDPPTVSMNFIPDDSPFAGTEGRFLTSRHLDERLKRETLGDVALHVEPLATRSGFKVSGRGELHISILIETMRREGYAFQVTRPQVLLKEIEGKKHEPCEELTIDVEESFTGVILDKIGARKGELQTMEHRDTMVRLIFKIPTRGLIGYRSVFLTDTKGMGIMNYVFAGYMPLTGEIKNRSNGALVVKDDCTSVGFALFNLQERGRLFIGPGENLYRGQIIGEHSRASTLFVNPAKGKKLTNIRASGTDDAILLTPPTRLSLEEFISFINDDEIIEVTPAAIRIRKMNDNKRNRS
jgi:GTP-binding protein